MDIRRIVSFRVLPGGLGAAAWLIAAAAAVQASLIGGITIQVDSQGRHGAATFAIPESAGNGLGDYDWAADLGAGGFTVLDENANPLATIRQLECVVLEDPAVKLKFSIQAGAGDTLVTFTAPTVTFAALKDPNAYATASITVTDANGNGATATGLFDGGKSYEARYNGSTIWAWLVNSVTVPANNSQVGTDRYPELPTIWEPISGTLSSIEAEYKFTLSANDTASGTSRFEVASVVPEPATWGLLGVALLVRVLRRR